MNRPGAVQRTDPTKSDVSVAVKLLDVPGLLPVSLQVNLHRFEYNAPAHQPATHRDRFLTQVVERRCGADSSGLAASGEEGVPHGWAGPHPGHSDVRKIKAQDSANGTLGGHRHRSAHQPPPSVGGNREFSQRLHLRPDAQATVLGDLQIFREIHHRFRVHGMTLPVVKVEDGSNRMGGHVHEHQIGDDVRPIGEMREVGV